MRIVFVLLTAALTLLTASALAADRVALVIGNGAYRHVPELLNPANDANAIAATLEGMGFEVIKGVDLDAQGMQQTLRRFVSAMTDAKVTLFYYAGHGIQVGGKNYLIPIDADLTDQASLDFDTVDADKVFGYMGSDDRVALAFLDACRDNPFTRSLARSIGRSRGAIDNGLALPKTSGSGLFIGFATAPDDVAADGAGSNSPFTTAMLKHLPTPGLEINQVMTRVKADVRAATAGEQRPWSNSDLYTEVFLVPVGAPPAETPSVVANNQPQQVPEGTIVAPVVQSPTVTTEDQLGMEDAWRELGTRSLVADVTAFIDRYPNGQFVKEAYSLLVSIKAANDVGDSEPEAWASLNGQTDPRRFEAYMARFSRNVRLPYVRAFLDYAMGNDEGLTWYIDTQLLFRNCLTTTEADGFWDTRSVSALERLARNSRSTDYKRLASRDLRASIDLLKALVDLPETVVCS